MELSKYISRCRNPKVIQNKRGNLVCVSCGHCPDCQARKLARLTSLCVSESLDNQKTFFITLTYDDENIPHAMLKRLKVNNVNYLQWIDMTYRYANPKFARKARKKLSTYKQEIHRTKTIFKDELFQKFYNKAHERDSKYFERKKYKWLPYLCKEDLQKFLKRLRFQISSQFNTEVRYFAVGEYGPEHFRPHFHVILFVNEQRLYSSLKDLVDKTWQYGITYTEPALDNKGCASYVASYTNSFTSLPSFLNGVKIRPFSLHSQNFGTLYNAKIRDYAYSLDRFSFEPFDVTINSGVRSVSLSDVISNSFFPRCYNYEFQDASSRYQLYTCYSELSRKYNFKRCSDVARCVLLDFYDYYNRKLLSRIDLDPTIYNADKLAEKIQFGESLDDFEQSIYNRLYSVINMSRLFCFNARSPELGPGDPHKSLIRLIDMFWSQKAQYNLKKQYIMQQEYHDRFESDDFDIFYPIGSKCDYKLDVYDRNEYIKQFNFQKDILYREKVKHKYQNDKNMIFT